MTEFTPSPFLDPGAAASAGTLAILHLKRDLLIPTVLHQSGQNEDSEYAEGKVTNTRFGSFPHSTLLNQPWGTQIRASNVDTGSRGSKAGKKRKRDTAETPIEDGETPRNARGKAASAASSGFIHIVPPTAESWTISLPHRTQVVYTPDSSYILQRLQVRPGDVIIEAGAGSGSFTHAAVRAVFSGYPNAPEDQYEQHDGVAKRKKRKFGKVYSFEYHEPRARQLQHEIKEHGLDQLVTITHRDVYQEGFCLKSDSGGASSQALEPQADAIFLDLPAPW